MSHVQRARGIGQHLQHVILRLSGVGLGRVERWVLLPTLGPLFFDALDVVAGVITRIGSTRGVRFGAGHRGVFFLRHGEKQLSAG